MPTAAIVGVGLMGGSLGLALRRKGWRVIGVGRNAARLGRAKRLGCLDEATTDWRAVSRADAVVLAVPVDEIVPWARRVRPRLRPSCLVMDVGSVKAAVLRGAERSYTSRKGPFFVGAHPMAGSEKTGAAHARADLYRGATCVLVPSRRATPAAVRRAESFWRSVGARLLRLSAAEHDRWVALVSHLPHLMAESLVLTAGSRAGAARFVPRLAAGSFRDMTRVAAADPAQWDAIFRLNRRALSEAARLFRARLSSLLGASGRRGRLETARRWRERFVGGAR
jgi:prephenate dehydrogenase